MKEFSRSNPRSWPQGFTPHFTDSEVNQTLSTMRRLAREWSDKAWALETAASMSRKAQAGYRDTTGLGDVPWDKERYSNELQTCMASALDFLQSNWVDVMFDVPAMGSPVASVQQPADDTDTLEDWARS